ncbi:MAG TPA: peptidylprolyl isomerase [Rhizobiaceae bacterium]|nr:peptidylprolyl isomerase [Rhizobiaceae bacterium]
MKLLPITPDDGLQGTRAAAAPSRGWARLLREPLVHFLVVGALLFGAYHFVSGERDAGPDGQKIELTQNDIRQLAVSWLAQGRPLPTVDQLRSLVDQRVTEEILFREAVSLGLDRDDEIIKRRLAQKMDFLAADLAAINEPTKAELVEWFSKNADRFALPPHVSFKHLYFSPDKHGGGARDAATATLDLVTGKLPDSPEVASAGDPFMFRTYYGDSTPEQVAKEFGPRFAETLFQLKPKSWQGPIQSGYGWHLVWVDSIEPGRVTAFEEVEPNVKSAWLDDRYREIKRNALEEMRSRYKVVVPSLHDIDLRGLSGPQAANASEGTLSQ